MNIFRFRLTTKLDYFRGHFYMHFRNFSEHQCTEWEHKNIMPGISYISWGVGGIQ